MDDALIIGNQWFFSSLLLQLRQRWIVARERNFLQQSLTYPLLNVTRRCCSALIPGENGLNSEVYGEPFRSLMDLGQDNIRRSLAHLAEEIKGVLKKEDSTPHTPHYLLYLCGFFTTDETAVTATLANVLHHRSLALFYRKMNFSHFCHDVAPQHQAVRILAMVGELCDIFDAITATLNDKEAAKEFKKFDRTILRSTAFFIAETLSESLEMMIECAKEVCFDFGDDDNAVLLARSLYAGALGVESVLIRLLRSGRFNVIRKAIVMLTDNVGNYTPDEKKRLRKFLKSACESDYFCGKPTCYNHPAHHEALKAHRESQRHLLTAIQPLIDTLAREIEQDEKPADFENDLTWSSFMKRLNRRGGCEGGVVNDNPFWTLQAFDVHTCRLTDTSAAVKVVLSSGGGQKILGDGRQQFKEET
eukprot:Blabericola_migrator_1__431@NODE_1102_length_5429_cov_104_416076_g755_i0_p2_GENE_NODE_1102_length_5429_cov_104_416076_g755_i0NODE_1102_length_5429_cov_104_416076_g755_i0_p2_ORF_typecomplete_len418_score64_62Snapin_Pallidin/PF14712_6/2_1e03Snapin_Pallidin/PF14712_6/0_88_NODE_1102_length_5429_cov_104_416076_g755_i022903543